MGLEIVLPPGLGEARASARAELLAESLARVLEGGVNVTVAPTYDELARRASTLAALLAGAGARPPSALLDVCNATGFALGSADDYAGLA